MMPGPVSSAKGGVNIRARLKPRSSKSGIAGMREDRVEVRVTAPPVEGAANAALLEVLSDALGVAKSRLRIVAGAKSREKVVFAEGVDAEAVIRLLSAAAGGINFSS